MLYSELYRVMWRRKALVGFGTLVCVALAFALTSVQEKSYVATATVRVEPVERTNANDSFEASQRLSRSYAEIYTQGAVIPRMRRYMVGQASPERSELAAQQLKDLDLLEVSGVAADPQRAVAIANAGAQALEQFSPRERLALITPATVPDDPASPNVRMALLLALVAGFVLTAGLVLFLEALLQPVSDVDDLERLLGIPVLAEVPKLPLTTGPCGPSRDEPESLFDESARRDFPRLETADDAFTGRARRRQP